METPYQNFGKNAVLEFCPFFIICYALLHDPHLIFSQMRNIYLTNEISQNACRF